MSQLTVLCLTLVCAGRELRGTSIRWPSSKWQVWVLFDSAASALLQGPGRYT